MFVVSPEREDRDEARRPVRRNHWAHRDPDAFVRYPRLPVLGYVAETRLIQRAQAGDIAARNEVWLHFLRLALAVVNDFHVAECNLADAIQEGAMGIKRAIEKFDPERLNSFTTYAWPWISNHIRIHLVSNSFGRHCPAYLFRDYTAYRRELRNCHEPDHERDLERRWLARGVRRYRLIRRFHSFSKSIPIHDLKPREHPARSDEDENDWRPPIEVCRELVARLHPRDRTVIELRFGLQDGRERTLREVGEQLHLTRERIRQIEACALKKLRRLARKHHPDYANELPSDEADAP
jgi:RNA polymerase primary sigma factor